MPIDAESISLCEGCDYVSVFINPVDAKLMDRLKDMGIRMIGTRTVGYDGIDWEHAAKIGLRVSNSAYSPDAVAEFSLMLMLMCVRRLRPMLRRGEINDFSMDNLCGRNLSGMHVGVFGTGSIGRRLIELLQGFGCKIYAYDLQPDFSLPVEYLSLDDFFSRSDIVSLHAPLCECTRHVINSRTLDLMPQGGIIVNTARGGLVDTNALISALKSNKISACALDVLEDEFGLFYRNNKSCTIDNDQLAVLKNIPNVIITPHLAFYSTRSVEEMFTNCIHSFDLDSRGEPNPFRIV